MRYALIGYPLGHSFSPFIHNELFKISGKPENEYFCHEIPLGTLRENYAFLASLSGFNVTIPYKTEIIDYCDGLDETASSCGAVNTVHKNTGYNTDIFGFRKSLEILGVKLNFGKRVCLIGYGGAGRMFAREILNSGARLTLAVNNIREYPEISKGKDSEVIRSQELVGEYDLIINASPVGMKNRADEGKSPVNFQNVTAEFAFDAIYNPAKTAFLTEAEKKGAKILNGLPMLVWQAAKAHEIWDGSVYDDLDIERIIENLRTEIK